MNIFLFIFFVICICRGLHELTSENPNSYKWEFLGLSVWLIVCGCMGAGVTLYKLVA